MSDSIKKYFKVCVAVNLILVFIVIAAGSIVRATGSGMGCPDWPTCFGKLIPPTKASQVTWHPDYSYKEGEMIIKDESLLVANQDFTTANDFVKANWHKYEKHDYAIFNPLHTWVEFINRLATVVLGFPIVLMFFLSFFYIKSDPYNTLFAFASLFMVGFQAWLGKIVVDKNLQGTTITYHMLGVFLLIGFLLLLGNRNRDFIKEKIKLLITNKIIVVSLISVLLSLVMIIFGTQVREEVDAIAKISSDRTTWVNQLSIIFIFHRSLIWLILGVNAIMMYQLRNLVNFRKHLIGIALLIVLESVIGVILSYFNMPAAAQPIHLLLAALLISIQFDLFIKLRRTSKLTLGKA